MLNLTIDPEFRDLIPPLSEEEFKKLEEGILDDGCRDPITVWGNTIVDGHNRYNICSKHGMYFNVNYMEFESREEAIEWILRNQLGRRNLNDFNRDRIALRYQEVIAKRMKERQSDGGKNYGKGMIGVDQKNHSYKEKTTKRKELAKIAGTSEASIQRTKLILEKGTPEQIERATNAKRGSRSDSITAIANEIRVQMKKDTTPETVYQEPDFGDNCSDEATEIKAEIPVPEPETKQCKTCKRILPLSMFMVTDGYHIHECKDCRKLSVAEKREGTYSIADVYAIGDQMQSAPDKPIEITIDKAVNQFKANAADHIRVLGKIVNMHKDIACQSEENKALMIAAIDEVISKIAEIKEILR